MPRRIQEKDGSRARLSAGGGEALVVGGFWRRLAAGFCDLTVVAPFIAAAFYLWFRVLWLELPDSDLGLVDWLLELPFVEDPLLLPGFFFSGAVGLVILYFFTAIGKASPGQRVLGLKVVDASGSDVGPFRSAFRTILLAISAGYLFLGVLWIGFDRLRQGWHDKLSGSYVVLRGSGERFSWRPLQPV